MGGLALSNQNGVFTFPYFTIEEIVLDANTILVANHINFPSAGERGAEMRDANEFIWLRLATPLRQAQGVGYQPQSNL